MRILAYNILKSGEGRIPLLADVISSAGADIAMMAEAGDPQQIQQLASDIGYPYYHSVGNSTAFMSRLPVDFEWLPSSFLSRSPILRLSLQDVPLQLFGVHLLPSLLNPAEWLRHFEVNALLNATDQDVPHILLGDFNTLAPEDPFLPEEFPTELKLIMRLNGGDAPRTAIGKILDAGYVDAFRHLHRDDAGYTMPTKLLAPIPNTRLDYAFLSPDLVSNLAACAPLRLPDAVHEASDHFPLLIELAL